MSHRFALPLFFVLLALPLGACSSDSACQQTIKDKCLSCHALATTCNKLGASEEQWLQTIDAMIKLQADVSPQERTRLARCLARADSPAMKELCSSP